MIEIVDGEQFLWNDGIQLWFLLEIRKKKILIWKVLKFSLDENGSKNENLYTIMFETEQYINIAISSLNPSVYMPVYIRA